MAIGILGTPVEINSVSGNYTAEAGSNRVVVMLAAHKSGAGQTLSNINWNSITRIPTVTIGDSAYEDRDGVGICIFKESELPVGAATATTTWSGSNFDISIFCFTIGDVDQSTTVRTSGSVAGVADGSGYTTSIAQTVTVGDFQLGVFCGRQNTVGFLTPQNSWTEDFDSLSGGNSGNFGVGHFTAVGTSSPCQWQHTDGGTAVSYALATVALIESTGSVISSATPSGTLTSRTRANLGCTTNVASGMLYAVIDTAANISGITGAQVVAGNRNDGGAALADTSAAVSSTSPSTGLFGALTKGTLYSYALCHVTGGNSNVLTGTFTTASTVDTYFTDFREYTAGSPPGDWTIADSGTGTLNVATDGTGPGGKVLQITTQSGVRYSRATWNDTNSDGDSDKVEVVALLRAPSGVAQYGLGMGVQVCRQAGVPYAGYAAMYGRDGYDPAGTGDIGLIRAGNSGQIASIATSTFTFPTAGEKVWLRLQKTGTTVNAWFWDYGAATKTNVDTPDLTNTDANYGSGDIGIYLDMVTSGFSVEVLAYGVGFNGVAPPMATYGAAVFGYQRMLRLNN